jgi:hypothetical protein
MLKIINVQALTQPNEVHEQSILMPGASNHHGRLLTYVTNFKNVAIIYLISFYLAQ